MGGLRSAFQQCASAVLICSEQAAPSACQCFYRSDRTHNPGSGNSAFFGTPSLEEWLHTRGINKLVICGITTNHCCETTARMAGNLGFDVSFILDATACFPRTDHEGKTVSADEIMRATAANLHGEFANVMTTANYVETCARNFN